MERKNKVAENGFGYQSPRFTVTSIGPEEEMCRVTFPVQKGHDGESTYRSVCKKKKKKKKKPKQETEDFQLTGQSCVITSA